jgi:hypothetical protein
MYYYRLGCNSYEESTTLFVMSDELLTSDDLHKRMKEAIKDRYLKEMLGKGFHIDNLIEDKLYPYLEKYNLHEVKIQGGKNYWSLNGIYDTPPYEDNFWSTTSDAQDKELFEELKALKQSNSIKFIKEE